MEPITSSARLRLGDRLGLYQRSIELLAAGVPPAEICRVLGISRDQLQRWLKGEVPRRERYDADLQPRPELAYLIGAYLGDGRTAGPDDKKVRFKLADRRFAVMLNSIVARIIGREPKEIYLEEGFHCVTYDAAALYDFLQRPLDQLRPWIEPYKADFVRGFFDAEGYATCSVDLRRRQLHGIHAGLANTNRAYLDLVRSYLLELGLPSRIRITNRKGTPMTIRSKTFVRKNDVFHVVIAGRDLRRFCEAIGSQNEMKAEKLRDLSSLIHESPASRFVIFTRGYSKVGRRWVKIRRPLGDGENASWIRTE